MYRRKRIKIVVTQPQLAERWGWVYYVPVQAEVRTTVLLLRSMKPFL